MNHIDYIYSNYTIVWKHPQATPNDWNTFLLKEKHNAKSLADELHYGSIRKTNGLFISLFATPGSFLLVEGRRGMKSSITPLADMHTRLIDTPHISPENVVGWDNEDFCFNEPLAIVYTYIYDIFEECCKDPVNHHLLCNISWKKTLNPLIEKTIENLEHLSKELDLETLFQNALDIAEKEMHAFAQLLLPLENKLLQLSENRNKIVDELMDFKKDESLAGIFHLTEEELFKLPVEILEKYLKVQELLAEDQQISLQALKIIHSRDKLIHKKWEELLSKKQPWPSGDVDFPLRTKCMIETLDWVNQYVKNPEAKVFGIFGGAHLEENLHDWSEEDGEERRKLCSLESLYRFLQDHKNFVILKPIQYDTPQ